MGRARIRSKVVQSTINNKDVIDMFQGVLGSGEATDLNLRIVFPKYTEIHKHCNRFMLVLEALSKSPLMGNFPTENVHLTKYVAILRSQAAKTFSAPDLAKLHPPTKEERAMLDASVMYDNVTKNEYDHFAAVYAVVKTCNVVNTVIVACKNLVPHKKCLEEKTDLSGRFLTRTGGQIFAPLPGLTALNFKKIYIRDILNDNDRLYILMVLHKLYTISHDVYDVTSAPDVDVGDFVGIIMDSLKDVKKAIPRCNEAFNKIRDSVGLLKGNFSSYYKDYVASNNPTIIMENFVLDVSKTTKSSPKVTRQFATIIKHYRNLTKQKAQHPKMQSLFNQVDKNFQELEKQSRLADTAEAEYEDEKPKEEKLKNEKPKTKQEKEKERNRLKKQRKRQRKRHTKAEKSLETMMKTLSESASNSANDPDESKSSTDSKSS